jgi:hypothetical protein
MKAALAVLLLLAAPAQARPVVVELFTSQACSSCPPADALLATLAKDPKILPLSFDVGYWNSPSWADSFALPGATDRQDWYATLRNSQEVYTPEAVVDGTAQLVGSNRPAITAAIAAASAAPAGNVPIVVSGGAMITVSIGGATGNGTLWLFGYDATHTTHIGGGENSGVTLSQVNVVRSISNLGNWAGQEMSMRMSRPAGQHVAVVLQTASGAILGAAAQ